LSREGVEAREDEFLKGRKKSELIIKGTNRKGVITLGR